MRTRLTLLTALILAAAATGAWAQDADEARGAILKRANPGDRITVTLRDGATMRGRLVNAKDGLVVRHDDDQRTFPFTEIDRVSRYKNGVILGPAVGTAAGLAVGLPLRIRLNNEGANGDKALTVVLISGIGIGTLLDALIGSEQTIYRRPTGRTAVSIAPARGGFTAQWQRTW